ncbi:hypothetical protein QQ045_006232 [Rhodiola kirilowii]
MAYQKNILWLAVSVCTMLVTVKAAKVPSIIVFGDSTMDAGNNNQISTLARSDFQPYGRDFAGGKPTGRFSNGRIPSDFISEAFGLKPAIPAYLDPAYSISDFAVGVTFASAGSGYDNATSDVLSVIPVWRQVEYFKEYKTKLAAYLGPQKARETISEALYLTSMGTNDFLENYYTMPQRRSKYNIEQYQTFLVGIAENLLRQMYSLGARKISLGGLPPMGCLPLERATNFMTGSSCNDAYNKVSTDFNAKLQGMAVKLNSQLPGIRVTNSNPYNIVMEMVQKPASYGFQVASMGCCASGTFEMGYICDRFNMFTCTDANKYVFWDAFHPTDKANKVIADHMVKTALARFL